MSTIKAEIFIESIGKDICCPFFDNRETLHVLLHNTGDILVIDNSCRIQKVHNTGGQPNGAIYTSNSDGAMYVTDFAHGAILSIGKKNQQEIVVQVYEDRPLKGPNSILMDTKGSIYIYNMLH